MNALAWIEGERHEGTWDNGTSQRVLFHVRHFCVMCCLIRRFTFSLLRKLSSTSSDGVRSGNLDVQLPLVVLFGGDACMAFLEIWCLYHCTTQT